MKVFISWSGEQSQALAKALHEWLPLVLHYTEPWLSQSDIDAGDRWGIKIAKELETTNFGIICVTKDNINSPWILFESGALAKSMEDGRVIPLLLDVDFKEISGPLAQFQAKKVEQTGISDIVTAMNKSHATPVPDTRLQQLFSSLWTGLETKISEIPKKASTHKQNRPQNEILEELVAGVRGLETRLRDGMDYNSSFNKRRKSRIYDPEMFMHITRQISRNQNDPIQILLISSMFRDDAPWLYELGAEAYRTIKAKDSKRYKTAYMQFMNALELFAHGPFFEDTGDKRTHFFAREALHMIDKNDFTNNFSIESPASQETE